MVEERKEFSRIYDWQAVVTMVLRPFLGIPEKEIWTKRTDYVLTMYGMYLKDQDAKEAEHTKQMENMKKNRNK